MKKIYKVMFHCSINDPRGGFDAMIFDEKYKGLHCKIQIDEVVDVSESLQAAEHAIDLCMKSPSFGFPEKKCFYVEEAWIPDDVDIDDFEVHIMN